MDETSIAALLAKQAITEVLHGYCRAMDRMDEALGRATFHPDATVDYGSMFTGSGNGFVAFAQAAPTGMTTTCHQLGNVLIRVAGDRAMAESYVTACFRLTGEDGAPMAMESHGRYHDVLERHAGRWAIVHRRYLHVMDETWPISSAAYPDSGRRDRGDPTNAAL